MSKSPRVVLYPPPSFYSDAGYDGGHTYIRQLARAEWAGDVYIYPDIVQNKAHVINDSQPANSLRDTNYLCPKTMLISCLPLFVRLLLSYAKQAYSLSKYLRPYRNLSSCIHLNGVGCEVAPIAAKLAGFKHVFGTVHNLPGEDIEAKRLARRIIERMSFRCCDHLIFPSSYCLKRWSCRLRIPRSHVVIYHGCIADSFECDLSQNQARKSFGMNVGDGVLVLGVAARLHECKGHKILFRAMAQISNEYPVNILVAGDGTLQIELEALAIELGISEQVTFIGQCYKMPLFYRAIDVNVLPSLSEGLGYSVVESMHAGLPQIVSDAGGMTELVRDSGAGIIFPSGDRDALANAIVDMYKRCCILETYGSKAREYAEKELSEESMLLKTLEFYKRCQKND